MSFGCRPNTVVEFLPHNTAALFYVSFPPLFQSVAIIYICYMLHDLRYLYHFTPKLFGQTANTDTMNSCVTGIFIESRIVERLGFLEHQQATGPYAAREPFSLVGRTVLLQIGSVCLPLSIDIKRLYAVINKA